MSRISWRVSPLRTLSSNGFWGPKDSPERGRDLALQAEPLFGIIIAMYKLLSKNWPLFGIGLLVLTVSFYMMARSRKEVVRKPALPGVMAEGVKLEDIHFTQEGGDDRVKWSLDAKEVRFSEDRNRITFTQFRLKLEPEDKPVVHLEGRNGHYDKTLGKLLLTGDLRGRTEDGYTIVTEAATYNQKEGKLTTDEAVFIQGPLFSVEGEGLAYDVATEVLEIKSKVKTQIKGRSWIS
jgi:LPS export ABC transporter protein LptC